MACWRAALAGSGAMAILDVVFPSRSVTLAVSSLSVTFTRTVEPSATARSKVAKSSMSNFRRVAMPDNRYS